MLDIQFIRDNPESVQQKSSQKGIAVDVEKLLQIDAERRTRQTQAEELRRRRNDLTDVIKDQDRPTAEQIAEGRQLKDEISALETQLKQLDENYYEELKKIPNMPLPDVPVGASEADNVVIRTIGQPPVFDFEPRNHAQIAESKGWLDKERAAKVAGARFAYLKGDLVMLDWALNMFVLSKVTNYDFIRQLIADNNLNVSDKPFMAVQPPAVANTAAFEATGRLDKEGQTYRLEGEDLWLNASAEHTMAPMYLSEILPVDDLPIRYIGQTTAFRREAGTYGKDMEGFFRLHQFNKLEMESFTTAASSLEEHYFLIAIQEYIMQALGLPYQVVQKCTADIGKPNARGVDIDVWLPGQSKYRETHTADLITDYQTRRMATRVRLADGSIEFAHTNDATALSQRPLIAIIENYQLANGDVRVPPVLVSYLNKEVI